MTSTAQRSSRYHARRRAGIAMLVVPAHLYGFINALLDDGRITDAAAENREAVADAAGVILSEYIQKVATRGTAGAGRCSRLLK